jgi:hypothetical protein
MVRFLFFICFIVMNSSLIAQNNPDQSMDSAIHTILLYPEGRPKGSAHY